MNQERMSIGDVVDPHFSSTSAAANLTFNERVKKLIKDGKDIAHFAFGQSPFPIPESVLENLKHNAHIHEYLPMKGIPELRRALVEFHLRYDGLQLEEENFIVSPGSKELIYLVMTMFKGVILLPSPSWTTYDPLTRLARKQTLILPLRKEQGWKISSETVGKGLEHLNPDCKTGHKLLILTNPGNPSGTCYTAQELQDLAECCRRNKILVLSDEIYARLTFDQKHLSMAKFFPEGTLLTSGFSKWASAGGWRVGYAYFPSSMRDLMLAVESSASHTYTCAPAPMQYAFAKALAEHQSELDDYMADCSAILKLVGDYCYTELASIGVTGHKSEAGYYFMPDMEVIRSGMKKRAIVTGSQMAEAILQEADVALLSCESFLRPSSDLSFRFCFVCFDGSRALKAYKALKEVGTVTPLALNEEGRNFVRKNCQTIADGVDRLKDWITKHAVVDDLPET